MARVPLSGGAYQSRSLIAAAQRQVNLYSENNAPGPIGVGGVATSIAPTKTTLYPTPGLVSLATPPAGEGRGLYRASNGTLYAVVGPTLYSVSPTWVYTALGSIGGGSASGVVPPVPPPGGIFKLGVSLLNGPDVLA